MPRQASTTAIGGFIAGIIGLVVVLLLFFSSGDYFSDKQRFVLYFQGSLHGLNVGAPVTIKGVQIGEVVDINIQMLDERLNVRTPVYITIRSDELVHMDQHRDRGQLLQNLIDRGLRAQLKSQSLLTGLLYIEVDFHPNTTAEFHGGDDDVPELPTVPTGLQEFTRNLEHLNMPQLLEDVQAIASGLNTLVNDEQLRRVAGNVNTTLDEMRAAASSLQNNVSQMQQQLAPLAQRGSALLGEMEQELPAITRSLRSSLDSINTSVEAIENAAQNLEHNLSADSPALHNVSDAAREVERAARSVRQLSELLERRPEVILQGKD